MQTPFIDLRCCKAQFLHDWDIHYPNWERPRSANSKNKVGSSQHRIKTVRTRTECLATTKMASSLDTQVAKEKENRYEGFIGPPPPPPPPLRSEDVTPMRGQGGVSRLLGSDATAEAARAPAPRPHPADFRVSGDPRTFLLEVRRR